MSFDYSFMILIFLVIWLGTSIFLIFFLPSFKKISDNYCIRILMEKIFHYKKKYFEKDEYENANDSVTIENEDKTSIKETDITRNSRSIIESNDTKRITIQKEGSIFLRAYNLYDNIVEMTSQGPKGKDSEALRIFDLLKFLSCAIIIYYHGTNLRSPLTDMPKETTLLYSLIFNMGQIVDVFFWISGFLNYLSLKKRLSQTLDDKNSRFYIVFFDYVWSRLVRVYAPYLFSLMYMTSAHSLILNLNENERDEVFAYETLSKNDSCWKNIFMIANHKCMQFSWYMADDLIIYAVFIIILYIPIKINQKLTFTKIRGSPMFFIFLFGFFLLAQIGSYLILKENKFTYSDYYPSIYPAHTCFPKSNKEVFFIYFTISPITRLYAFLYGAIFALLFEVYSTKKISERIKLTIQKARMCFKIIFYLLELIFVACCYFIAYMIWRWIFMVTKPIQYQADLWLNSEQEQYLLWWRLIVLSGISFMVLPGLMTIPFDIFHILF